MKYSLTWMVISILIALELPVQAQQKACVQPLWSMHYGGSGQEQFQRIIPSAGGGFVAVGYTESSDGDVSTALGGRDVWVVRLDSLGQLMWELTLGGSQDEVGKDVLELPDGGLLVLASTSSTDGHVSGHHGAEDVWVVRLDASGKILWSRAYGGPLSESAERLLGTGDGFVVVGYSQSASGDVPFNRGDFDYWIFKIDMAGNVLWSKTYGGSLADWAYGVSPSSDGNLLVCGSSFSSDGDVLGNLGFYDFWVIKLDLQGQLLWAKNFGGPLEERLYDSQAAPDGGVLMVGTSLSTSGDVPGNYGSYDAWLLRLDADGQLLWSRHFGGAQEDRAFAVKSLGEGWLVGAFTSSADGTVSSNHGLKDAWLLRLDDAGNLLWEKNFGGTAEDRFFALAIAPSGAYAAAGLSASADFDLDGNHGLRDAWVIELRPDSLAIDLGADTLICAGQRVVLQARVEDAQILWSDGSTGDSLVVEQSGLYWVEADRSGCKARDSMRVDVAGDVPLDLGPDTLLCVGEVLRLQPQIDGDSYRWQDGSTESYYLVNQPGTYWVEVHAGPCAVSDTIEVDFLSVDFSLGPDTLLCEGQTLLLDAYVPDATYLWQDGSQQSTFEVKAPGSYAVRVGQYGCYRSDTIEVKYQYRPDSILPDYRYFCQDNPLWVRPPVEGASFLWPDGTRHDAFRIYSPGEWAVQIELNGCLFADTIDLTDCMKCIYVPNAFSPNGDGVNDDFRAYPVCPLVGFELEVYNRWGRLMFRTTDPNEGWDGLSDGKRAMPGLYVWRLNFGLLNGPNTIELQRSGSVTLVH